MGATNGSLPRYSPNPVAPVDRLASTTPRWCASKAGPACPICERRCVLRTKQAHATHALLCDMHQRFEPCCTCAHDPPPFGPRSLYDPGRTDNSRRNQCRMPARTDVLEATAWVSTSATFSSGGIFFEEKSPANATESQTHMPRISTCSMPPKPLRAMALHAGGASGRISTLTRPQPKSCNNCRAPRPSWPACTMA